MGNCVESSATWLLKIMEALHKMKMEIERMRILPVGMVTSLTKIRQNVPQKESAGMLRLVQQDQGLIFKETKTSGE